MNVASNRCRFSARHLGPVRPQGALHIYVALRSALRACSLVPNSPIGRFGPQRRPSDVISRARLNARETGFLESIHMVVQNQPYHLPFS
jgi:hypothetical protein